MVKYFFILLTFLLGTFNLAFSQQTEKTGDYSDTYYQVLGILVLFAIIIMFIIILVYTDKKYEHAESKVKTTPEWLVKLKQMLTNSVPIEQEADIMLDHDYDGIKELDNKIPPWFNILFYGSIIFGLIYFGVFHVFKLKPLMIQEYADEMIVAQQQRAELIRTGAFINEETITALTDNESINNGKQTFMTSCTPCHGLDGGGTVGPNLTDDYWINGGGIKNIFKTIKYGVPAKGMISWQTSLSPKKMQEVASYILTLRGTNPPTGKPPEGELYKQIDSVKTSIIKDSLKIDTTKKVIK
jgi:cytochrome c oxidase cbb3-type subunit III